MDDEGPTISVLLLGDADVGKSTFLSMKNARRVSLGANAPPNSPLPRLLDHEQPFVFNLRTRKGPFRLEFYDTASPENYTLLRPDMLVLCYSVASRPSLVSVKTRWKHLVETHFNYDEHMPVMVLGLQRDRRTRRDDPDIVIPQEGVATAQDMRCDIYAECSAVSGELMREAWDDIVQRAVGTVLDAGGGKTPGTRCVIL